MMRISTALSLTIFLAAAIALVGAVPALYLIANRSNRASRTAVADACAAVLSAARDERDFANKLIGLQQRYGLASLALVDRSSRRTQRDDTERRETPLGIVEVRFADETVGQALRVVRITLVAASAAALAGMTLLALNILAIMRGPASAPEAAAEPSPRAGSSDLFRTFEISVKSLQGRERELRRLHDREKERADELTMVSGALVRSLTSGFIAIDDVGRLVEINQTARELLGVGEQEPAAGQSVTEALRDSPFARELGKAVEHRATLQRVEIAQDEAGSRIIGLSTVPLLDATGRYYGLLALFTDLTPVRKLELRIRDLQSLADLGEMAAGIAHEFRNSLSAILGYIRLARKEPISEPAEQRLVGAEEEARSLNEAVEKLLAFSRPLSVQRQRVDLREVLGDVAGRLHELHTTIRFDLRPGSASIDGDVALLTRAFENIMRNAVDAIEEKENGNGCVTIEVTSEPETRVRISDDGVGIDEADASRLFLPFQSGKPKGFGLGLFLVRKIVLLHGGTVRLGGRRGEGASVTIDFASDVAAPP